MQHESIKGVRLQEHGSEDCLSFVKELPLPSLGDSDVLVNVKACAISDIDIAVRKGAYKDIGASAPLIPGYEISGVVVKIGQSVPATSFAVGDEVFGMLPLDVGGGCSEQVAIACEYLVRKPLSVSFDEAAASVMPGLRAYNGLFYHTNIRAGDFVLITNGASPLAHLCVQLAAAWGAKVIATITTSEEFNYLQDLNIGLCRIIDLSSESLIEAVMDETGSLGVDCIIDNPYASISSTRFAKHDLLRCLAVNGTWVAAGSLQLDPPDTRLLSLKNAKVAFAFEPAWAMSSAQLGRFQHILTDIATRLGNATLRPKVAKVFPLEKVREAHRISEMTRVGRTIITNKQ